MFIALLKPEHHARNDKSVKCEITITKVGTKKIEFTSQGRLMKNFTFSELGPLYAHYQGIHDRVWVRIYRTESDYDLAGTIAAYHRENGPINLINLPAAKAVKIMELLED